MLLAPAPPVILAASVCAQMSAALAAEALAGRLPARAAGTALAALATQRAALAAGQLAALLGEHAGSQTSCAGLCDLCWECYAPGDC